MSENKKTKVKKEEKPKVKKEEKVETSKKEKIEAPKKVEKKVHTVAKAKGDSLSISAKYAIAICKVIRNKSPENAIKRLEEVINEKRAIPMAGLEVAHQKGKGLSGGKYPKNACKEIIQLIKQVEANANANEIENPIITLAIANRAPRPFRTGGRQAKRAHVYLEVRDKTKLINKKTKLSKKKKK